MEGNDRIEKHKEATHEFAYKESNSAQEKLLKSWTLSLYINRDN